MAGWRVSGGILRALSLAFSSSLRLATCVVAGTTTGMALTFDSVAVTPAAAEAPSDGRGPAISRYSHSQFYSLFSFLFGEDIVRLGIL